MSPELTQARTQASPPTCSTDSRRRPGGPTGLFLVGLGLVGLGSISRSGPQDTQVPLPIPAGGTADSNGRMIAVTGVDVTGQSVLYLIDSVDRQLAVYQANGGSSGTMGLRLIGARKIDLDLQLEGFNDKTEDGGRPLKRADLEKMFEKQGLIEED
jgi:hypothetical protein